MSGATDQDGRAIQAAMLVELRAIHRLLRAPPRDRACIRADYDRLAVILPPVAGASGSEWFLCRDLFEDDRPALRVALADLTPKRLGRLLRRAEGVTVAGLVVERGGVELGSTLWRVVGIA